MPTIRRTSEPGHPQPRYRDTMSRDYLRLIILHIPPSTTRISHLDIMVATLLEGRVTLYATLDSGKACMQAEAFTDTVS